MGTRRSKGTAAPIMRSLVGTARNVSVPVVVAYDHYDQVYDFEDGAGTRYRWDVGRALQMAQARGDLLTFCPADHGITLDEIRERHRNLNERYAMTTDTRRPVLFVQMPSGEHQLIDGWHRLFRAIATGVQELPAYLLTNEEAAAVRIL